ncbi:MAG: DUF5683 domain-containing protein [Leptospira sp.]|nr:DUF5683 domain-containing protein [Leptospira sp.]
MWNNYLRILIFQIFLINGTSILAEGPPETVEETMVYQLKWQEVPGASGYLLEIKNSSGYMVISEKTNSNFYNAANFLSGTYEHRVGVINKIGKVGSFSDWVPFEVVVSRIPSLSKDRVYSISREEKTKTIEFSGKDFLPQMKVYMILDGKKIPAKKVEIESATKARAVFDIDPELDTGLYDLVLENPRKKTLNAKQRIVLSDSKEQAERFASRQEKIINKEIPEDYYQTPYWSTIWRSTVLPGWGQNYIEGSSWKLYTYPLIGLGIAGAYANSYNKFLGARSSYQDSVILGYFLADNPDAQLIWLLNRNTAQSNYSAAKQELNNIQTGIGVFGVFILYNLIDAYFSARRNVAFNDIKPGLPIGQENIRLNARMERGLPQTFSLQPLNLKNEPIYNLEILYQF